MVDAVIPIRQCGQPYPETLLQASSIAAGTRSIYEAARFFSGHQDARYQMAAIKLFDAVTVLGDAHSDICDQIREDIRL